MALEALQPERIEEIFADGVDRTDVFTVLALANMAVERLRHADTSALSREERRYYARGVEALRNETDAAAVDAARQLDTAGHEAESGFFTAAGWMRHHLQLSSAESRVRMQIVRLYDALPAWERAARRGDLGVEQVRLAARTFARTAIRDSFIDQSDRLLDDAINQPFRRFEQLLSNLRELADPDTSRRESEHRHRSRRLTLRREPDGSWRLSARFGDVQGAEINEILAHYNDAEWRTDWHTARQHHGDNADISLDQLDRTDPQRRADALHQALLAAAANPGKGKQPLPTLNVLIDGDTLTTELTGGDHDPARYRDMVCRTQDGEPLPIAEASTMALFAHLRRVVLDSAGTIIDLGRRSRLFTGAARDAVMLTHETCIWFGCDAPIRRTQADHHIEWLRHQGRSSPHNGGPLCGRHNRLKERHRYRVVRRPDGDYDITHPDGTPLT